MALSSVVRWCSWPGSNYVWYAVLLPVCRVTSWAEITLTMESRNCFPLFLTPLFSLAVFQIVFMTVRWLSWFLSTVFGGITFRKSKPQISTSWGWRGLLEENCHGVEANNMYDSEVKENFHIGTPDSLCSKWWDVGAEPIWVTNQIHGGKIGGVHYWRGSETEIFELSIATQLCLKSAWTLWLTGSPLKMIP